jgi:hypothetical protein
VFSLALLLLFIHGKNTITHRQYAFLDEILC